MSPIEKAFREAASALRKLFAWFALLVVSPTGFSIINWWKSKKQESNSNTNTTERKPWLERIKKRRENRRRN